MSTVTIGRRFGRLRALSFASPRGRHLNCICDCGTKRVVRKTTLLSGSAQSCGCRQRELTSARKSKHRHCANGTHSKVYDAWRGMKKRCLVSTTEGYSSYGGRGITVCDRWLESFDNFLSDMGEPPTRRHQLDRIDNDGNYEPGNCRWATATVQGNNRRTTRLIAFKGETRSIVGWAKHLRINITTLHRRIAKGWDVARAIESPVRDSGGSNASV